MASILVSSSENYSGKSSICSGLGLIIKERGKSVGYMKPVGNLLVDVDGVLSDEDAEQMRDLLALETPRSFITPIMLTENLTNDALLGVEQHLDETLKQAYSEVSRDKDMVIIEGEGGIGSGAMYNLSDPQVASILDSKILLITCFDSVRAVDRILCDIKLIADRNMLSGVILNEVEEDKLGMVRDMVVPFLEKRGVKVFGVIPRDHTLGAVSIAEIVEDLRGDVLTGAQEMGILVEHYLVGAMEVNSAIKYFRRTPNSVVVTGGDRADIQMAAIEAGARALILTGNLRPSEAVLGSADEAGVAVVLVRGDTLSTIERMENLIGHARIQQKAKIETIVRLIKENVDVDSILDSAGL
jgi:hypothetical protein